MHTTNENNCSRANLIIFFIVLAIYSLLIVTSHHYERMTADSTLYINIAEKYMRGEYGNAINGYWSPLVSWMLIPLLYFGSSHVFAINALHLIVGGLSLTGVLLLSYRFEITEKIRGAILISMLPILLLFSIVEIFDYLILCILVFYFGIIFNNQYHEKLYNGILCGVLGALAYLTKSYAFYFFIVHFLVLNTAHFIRSAEKEERIKVVKNAVVGMLLFALISGAWVTQISDKYGHLTFSNHKKTALGLLGPGTRGEGFEFGWPIFYKGFYAPPNETAVSVWEDPSYIEITPWSPWSSLSDIKYFIKHIITNIFDGLKIFESFSRLSSAIVLGYILLFLVQPFSRKVLRGDMFYSLFSIILYSGGYAMFHFEARYMWIANVLLLLMGGHLVTLMTRNDFFKSKARTNILIVIFALSFMLTPLKSYSQAGKDSINKNMHLLSMELKDKYNISGNLASNREWEHAAIHDAWHKTFRIAYWLDSRYYGQASKDSTGPELQSEFEKYNMDYYMFWGEPDGTFEFLSQFKEVTGGEIPGLNIYSLKEPLDRLDIIKDQ